MKTLVLGSLGLGLIACWTSSSTPVSPPSAGPGELSVTDAEVVVGRTTRSEGQLAREQAIEQARAAGIIGPQVAPPTGPLDKDALRRGIRAHLKPIALCYEQRLLLDATLQGTMEISFAIGPDGSVVSATASSFDAEIEACVADVVKGIPFPAPAGGGTVQASYPFVFKPAS